MSVSKIFPWLTRDVTPISLSACFADMGYQAVTAVFPLIIVIQLKEPAYVYGLLLALSYGVGSVFSLFGGKLGDTHEKDRNASWEFAYSTHVDQCSLP